MNIKILLEALRQGATLPNPTPVKWFSLGATLLAFLLSVASTWAASKGYVTEAVSFEDAMLYLVPILTLILGAGAVGQVASSKTLGILPPKNEAPDEKTS